MNYCREHLSIEQVCASLCVCVCVDAYACVRRARVSARVRVRVCARMRARAHRDGVAARQSVNEKRVRYPAERVPGASLVPFVVECVGRASDEAAALVRYWGSASEDPALSTSRLWQQLATTVQLGTAECILSATGPQSA